MGIPVRGITVPCLDRPFHQGLASEENAQTGAKVPNERRHSNVHVRRIALLLLCGLLALTGLAGAAEKATSGEVFPFKVYKQTLDNGMRVVAIPYDSPGTLAYQI